MIHPPGIPGGWIILAFFSSGSGGGFFCRFLLLRHALAALFETVAVAVHFQDVDMMGQTVEQGPRQSFRAKGLGPFIKGQV